MTMKEVREVFYQSFPDIDDIIVDYFVSYITDNGCHNKNSLRELFRPFIKSYELVYDNNDSDCNEYSDTIIRQLQELLPRNKANGVGDTYSNSYGNSYSNNNENNDDNYDDDNDDEPKLLSKKVVLSDLSNSLLNENEKQNLDSLWGFQNIRDRKNNTIIKENSEAESAKNERKAMKEQKKFLSELDNKYQIQLEDDENNNNQISTMTLPDYSSGRREKDIHVSNFNITYGGKLLLDCANLKIVFGRRYGLVGRNGIGKTTLLKHMATFQIEGFPRHHRVLHVKQEVGSSTKTVLEVVLQSDVERNNLLENEKLLQEKVKNVKDNAELESTMDELNEVIARMDLLEVHSAESRAATILSGLQFSHEMQNAPTNSLSGGWRMRVSLAGALLIQPDLLMLDEPTNHLDLEAVLWLEEYLKGYPNTVLLVSHDRAFMNEVCTDIIQFKDQKLEYFRGNYDAFESSYREQLVVQQRQHEAQKVKLLHMQEFVDKFRFNAKRAALVQSRIKAIERETVVDAVEEEQQFRFSFIDAGQLGRPIIQLDCVTFGYKDENILFSKVDLDVDQQSRIALVGPNGSGKSTLLNLIQGKLNPIDGIIKINQQLRIAVFTQHHLDTFDLSLSPLQNMMARWQGSTEAEIRAHLGRYEITGNDAIKPMKYSSGGQKSRVSFACLTYAKPHVVILDEPTNHLDMGAIEALTIALKEFKGGVLLISHDQHFINSVCNEIWIIKDKKVTKFNGSFHDYKHMIITKK